MFLSGSVVAFDAGDLDGDVDIVLGAFNLSFHDVPEVLVNEWRLRGPSVVILKNTLRE